MRGMLVFDVSSSSPKRDAHVMKKRKEEKYTKKTYHKYIYGTKIFLGVATCWWPPPHQNPIWGVEFTQPAPAWWVMFVIIFRVVHRAHHAWSPPLTKLRLRLYLCQVSTLYPLIFNALTHSLNTFGGSGRPNRRLLAPCTTLKFVCSVTHYYTILYRYTHTI